MWQVNFERLHLYSLAGISDPAYLDTLAPFLTVTRKPVCTASS